MRLSLAYRVAGNGGKIKKYCVSPTGIRAETGAARIQFRQPFSFYNKGNDEFPKAI